MASHDFGIIDNFEESKGYSNYEPEKYNCVSVDDNIIEDMILRYKEELSAIKTYYHTKTQPGKGLDYCGVTIIPPESLQQFRDVILKAINEKESYEMKVRQLEILIDKVTEAIKANKHIIHYGI